MCACECGCHMGYSAPWGSRRERGPGRFWGPHFISKAEQIERLQEYKEVLEKELAGVKEAIEELKR